VPVASGPLPPAAADVAEPTAVLDADEQVALLDTMMEEAREYVKAVELLHSSELAVPMKFSCMLKVVAPQEEQQQRCAAAVGADAQQEAIDAMMKHVHDEMEHKDVIYASQRDVAKKLIWLKKLRTEQQLLTSLVV
jgi:hypothetical protein